MVPLGPSGIPVCHKCRHYGFDVSWNGEARSWESVPDILDYLHFAGFEVTRDQLARLHRRRLINQPFHGPNGGRGLTAMYPAGTAERMVRISQLKENTKQLDELAWRLWWEGHDVEPDLVRSYVTKKAERWDEQVGETPVMTSSRGAPDEVALERDVLEEVFFQHLKVGPSLASARRQLGRGTELFVDFGGLLIDLLRGDLSVLNRDDVDLFRDPARVSTGSVARDGARRTGVVAAEAMRASLEVLYVRTVEELDDKELASARPIALRFLGIIANVGGIVQHVFGGSGRGRENIGKSLIGVSESPDEQVLALLLTSAFLRDELVREGLPDFEPLAIHLPAVTFGDFVRLRYLAGELEGLSVLLAPERMRDAFGTPEGAQRWRASLEGFFHDHILEIEEVMGRRPDLFEESPPDDVAEVHEEIDVAKKKILNDVRGGPWSGQCSRVHGVVHTPQ